MRPEVLEKANSVLSYLQPFTTYEGKHPFVECATFADEIKGKGWGEQADLHYVNTPFFDEGFFKSVEEDPQNATFAIVSVPLLTRLGLDHIHNEKQGCIAKICAGCQLGLK